ncbi:MAG TPA: PIN domain-containing protein [Terriglobales bacterium]|nr:PIN domain-containing protein [Terriglobales bacterium]
MDVALDANVILNDPRMEGNAFLSLLDYLRKTGSRLVLSKVVIEEVVAAYPRRLQPALHKATVAVRAFNAIVTHVVELPNVDLDAEIAALTQRLLNPSKHITPSLILKNYTDVALEEVVIRGVRRIPPANQNGEELRDVIHWLMILAHARASKRELAFITSDEHFKQDADLHPSLKKEVRDNDLSLHFYPSVDDFIKAHSPRDRSLSESDAVSLLGRAHVMDRFEIEARPALSAIWRDDTVVHVVERNAQLTRGALYKVGNDSEFGELEFVVDIVARVTSRIPVVSAITGDFFFPLSSSDATDLYNPGTLEELPEIDTIPNNPFIVTDITDGSVINAFPHKWSEEAMSSNFLSIPHHSGTFVDNTSDFHVTGNIVISLRIVSGKVLSVQTERVAVTGIKRRLSPRPEPLATREWARC